MSWEEDLLGRSEKLTPDSEFAETITGKRVMVTGAGGSIGTGIVQRLLHCFPEHLSLVTNTEQHLYEISRTVYAERPGLAFSSVLCDIRDRARVKQVIARELPSVIFHCAALKHIPLLEINPCEGILTNVGGTKNVVDAAVQLGVSRVVLLTTDKAVAPSSVMGMTKRVAELYCLGVGEPCRVARLVNVFGSSGSVVPLFQQMIREGVPLTVTHRQMVRYFITLREAADYLLQAATLEVDGPGVFVPAMGPSTNIAQLAMRMLAAAGRNTEQIQFTEIRPGEKLDEELFYPHETARSVSDTVLFAPSSVEMPNLEPLLARAEMRQDAQAVDVLKEMVGSGA